MIVINKTEYGTNLSLNTDNYVQNVLDLNKIWNNPKNYYKINSNINTKGEINISIKNTKPNKALSFLLDCTKEECYFNRYNYCTRDFIENSLLDQLKYSSTKEIYLAVINPFMLLTELFYITSLIKNGYLVKEIHLVDPAYFDVLNIISNMNNLNYDFIKTHVFLLIFYQFLEYFSANKNPISIYIHSNPITFGKNNVNRINLTIEIDSNAKTDIVNMLAIKMCTIPASINIFADYYKYSFFGYKYDIVYVRNYKFENNKVPEKIIGTIEKNFYDNGSNDANASDIIFNTNYCYDDIKKILKINNISIKKFITTHAFFLNIIVALLTIILLFYFVIKLKKYYGNTFFYFGIIVLILFVIYTYSVFKDYRPIYLLKC